MKRSTYAARSAGLIQSEILENRRLFAGMPSFGGHGEFGHHFAAGPRGPWGDAVVISLPLGGFMHSLSDGNSTTAFSSSYSVDRTAPTASSSANEPASAGSAAQVIRTTSAPRPTETVAVNVQTGAATQMTIEAPVVQQVLPDTNPLANTAARSAAANAVIDVAGGPVFGPFTLGPVLSESTPVASSNNAGSLLTIDPDAVDRSLRWQSQDATYRPKRAASPTASSEEVSLELAARAAIHVQQATLVPVPVELTTRPLWQRLATVAAAGLLVVTNTIVRRRQRRAAKVMAR